MATPSPGLFKTSVSSATSLMALQLFSRGFTFMINQALFRLASPTTFGAAAIQFELILSTILFLSREGVRNALLRVTPGASADTAVRRMNLSFLPILLGIPLASSTSILYIHFAGQEIRRQPHFESAILLYALAAMTELLSEPMYNVAMTTFKMHARVRAEGLGITIKSIATFLVLLFDSKVGNGNLALIAFALGQLLYSITVLTTYLLYFGLATMHPNLLTSSGRSPLGHVDSETLKLSLTMTIQSLVKHFLTEGDKVIISWFSPLHDQGGYAIATNYGSLIARIVFQPIEETLRLFFSRTLGAETREKGAVTQAADTLNSLLSVQIAFSIILVVFGTAYLPILLPLLLPQQYISTSAPSVLAAWVWYIPVLALNGGLEALLSSVATRKDLNTQSRWMVVFSITYIISAIPFYRLGLGDPSLVYANIVNLCARIFYCLIFVDAYFKKAASAHFRFYKVLPPWELWVTSLTSAAVIHVSERRLNANELALQLGRRALMNVSVLLHVAIGSSLAILCILTWWISSGRYLNLPLRRKAE